MRGIVPIPRKDFHRPVFRNAEDWRLYCLCRERASIASRWVSVQTGKGATRVYLEAGQLIYGRHRWAKDLELNPSTVARSLKRLEKHGLIRIQAGTHFSVVTIVDWPGWGDGEPKSGQAMGRQTGTQTGTQKRAANPGKTRVSGNGGAQGRAGKRAGKWAHKDTVESPLQPPQEVEVGSVEAGTAGKKTAPGDTFHRRLARALGKRIVGGQREVIDRAAVLVAHKLLPADVVLDLAGQASKCQHPAQPFWNRIETEAKARGFDAESRAAHLLREETQ